MQFDILSIGDVEFLNQVFIALALIAGSGSFEQVAAIGALFGMFFAAGKGIVQGGRTFPAHDVLVGVVLFNIMFVPKVDVSLESVYSGTTHIVQDVPIGPAAAGGLISAIGYKMMKLISVAYDPLVPGMDDGEFASALKYLNGIRDFASGGIAFAAIDAANGDPDGTNTGVDTSRSLNNYLRECVADSYLLGSRDVNNFITGSLIDQIASTDTATGTRIYLNPAAPDGVGVTCADAYNQIQTALIANFYQSGDTAALDEMINKGMGLAPGTTSFSNLDNYFQYTAGVGQTVTDYMAAATIRPAVDKALAGRLNNYFDVGAAIQVQTAIEQRNTDWAMQQSLFMTVVKPMVTFFEGFIYAVTPFMALIITMGAQGVSLASKYVLMILWIQLWTPILSIINLYIHMAAGDALDNKVSTIANWGSYYASDTISAVTQNWIATGGMLASATPAIALMLIYGSSVTATHLAGRMSQDQHVDEKGIAPDTLQTKPYFTYAGGGTGDSYGTEKAGSKADSFAFSSNFSSAQTRARGISDRATEDLAQVASSGTADTSLWSAGYEHAHSWAKSQGGDFSKLAAWSEREMRSMDDGTSAGSANQRAHRGNFSAMLMALSNGVGFNGMASFSNTDSLDRGLQKRVQSGEGFDVSQGDSKRLTEGLTNNILESAKESNSKSLQTSDTFQKAQRVSNAYSAEDSLNTSAGKSTGAEVKTSVDASKFGEQLNTLPNGQQLRQDRNNAWNQMVMQNSSIGNIQKGMYENYLGKGYSHENALEASRYKAASIFAGSDARANDYVSDVGQAFTGNASLINFGLMGDPVSGPRNQLSNEDQSSIRNTAKQIEGRSDGVRDKATSAGNNAIIQEGNKENRTQEENQNLQTQTGMNSPDRDIPGAYNSAVSGQARDERKQSTSEFLDRSKNQSPNGATTLSNLTGNYLDTIGDKFKSILPATHASNQFRPDHSYDFVQQRSLNEASENPGMLQERLENFMQARADHLQLNEGTLAGLNQRNQESAMNSPNGYLAKKQDPSLQASLAELNGGEPLTPAEYEGFMKYQQYGGRGFDDQASESYEAQNIRTANQAKADEIISGSGPWSDNIKEQFVAFREEDTAGMLSYGAKKGLESLVDSSEDFDTLALADAPKHWQQLHNNNVQYAYESATGVQLEAGEDGGIYTVNDGMLDQKVGNVDSGVWNLDKDIDEARDANQIGAAATRATLIAAGAGQHAGGQISHLNEFASQMDLAGSNVSNESNFKKLDSSGNQVDRFLTDQQALAAAENEEGFAELNAEPLANLRERLGQ